MLCNSLVQTLQHFLKNPLIFLTTISLKNHPQKLLRIPQIHFFPLLPWAAKTAPTEEFVFQNVAYRPTVYRTGGLPPIPAQWKDTNYYENNSMAPCMALMCKETFVARK